MTQLNAYIFAKLNPKLAGGVESLSSEDPCEGAFWKKSLVCEKSAF